MLQGFSNLKSTVKSNRLSTESFVFYLHYRVSFLILMFCCVLVYGEYFIKDKIECLFKTSPDVNSEFLNNYCWSTYTYSVPEAYQKKVGIDVPHPGISGSETVKEYEYRNYYQYVPVVLFIQGILFYIPHAIWKGLEGNFIKILLEAVSKIAPDKKDNTNKKSKAVPDKKDNTNEESENVPDKKDNTNEESKILPDKKDNTNEESIDTIDIISTYIADRWGKHKLMALKYFMCEILSTTNIMIQTYLLDILFYGKFLGLGLLTEIYYNSEILSDPLRLFPIVTVCHFRKYGPTGFIDEIDALCVLPVNALNAKIFLFLWIWFAVMFMLSLFHLLYLLLCFILPFFRIFFFKTMSSLFHDRQCNQSYTELISEGDFGDWFVLSSLKQRTDYVTFSLLVDNISTEIRSQQVILKRINVSPLIFVAN